jgi:RNA polymerase sigma factor (sigma-70 family)
MLRADVGTTSQSKLRAISDWGDHRAWVEFQEIYEPLLRRCCARLRLDKDAADEVCQETWIEVAKRMRSFVYNPQRGTFRGWLWKVCYHKAMDYLGRRKDEQTFSFDERDERARLDQDSVDLGEFAEGEAGDALADDGEGNTVLTGLFREGKEIQAAVRRRVEPHTWEAFWLVGVLLWTVDETAQYLQMSHTNVYKAKARVTKLLQSEARRRALGGIELGSADRRSG